jgi:hypothetical protein
MKNADSATEEYDLPTTMENDLKAILLYGIVLAR